jgi:hypothetical protein
MGRFDAFGLVARTVRVDGERDVRRRPCVGRRAPKARLVGACGIASASVCGWLPSAVIAQSTTDAQRAPTLTIERYSEDWSTLADPEKRTGHWTERFKYIPLDADGSTYLTTGIEVRERYEGYQNVNWGSAPNDDYVWHRVMPYADLHVGNVRFFAQPIFAAISFTNRPKSPADETGADMLQAFGEADLKLGGSASLRISAGRKLISLGAGRFVDTRYGPNVPQAFDGFDATVTGKSLQVRALYLRPVDTRSGDFNDHTSHQKAIWGLYATRWFRADRSTGIDVYYLGFRDRNAVFDQGAGREVIKTFGTRIFGDTGRWYWNLEAALQRGRFAEKRVEAGGIGGEIGHRLLATPLKPTIALTADYISGDGDPKDGKLGTFNPMFPRGKYFASQSPVGPRNLIHIQPSLTIQPRKDIAVSFTGVAYWRASTRDGIYNIPGILMRGGQGSDARYVGNQYEIAVAWQATAELNLSASIGDFVPGRFIRDTGPARPIRVAGLAANFRF